MQTAADFRENVFIRTTASCLQRWCSSLLLWTRLVENVILYTARHILLISWHQIPFCEWMMLADARWRDECTGCLIELMSAVFYLLILCLVLTSTTLPTRFSEVSRRPQRHLLYRVLVLNTNWLDPPLPTSSLMESVSVMIMFYQIMLFIEATGLSVTQLQIHSRGHYCPTCWSGCDVDELLRFGWGQIQTGSTEAYFRSRELFNLK